MSRSDVTLSRMFIRRMMALAGMMTLLPAHEYLNHRPQSKSPKSTFVMFFVVSKAVLFFLGGHYVWHASHDFLVSNAFLCWWWPMTCLLCLARQRYAPPFAEVMLQCKCLMIFVTLQPLVSSELIALSILWSRLSGGLSMFLLSKSFECSTRFNSLFPGLTDWCSLVQLQVFQAVSPQWHWSFCPHAGFAWVCIGSTSTF